MSKSLTGLVVVGLSSLWLAGCGTTGQSLQSAAEIDNPTEPESVDTETDLADFEVYLQQDQDYCAFTVGIRNWSTVRKGASRIEIEWLDAEGERLGVSTARMDPVRVERYDAKNARLDGIACADIRRLRVRSARWTEWNDGRHWEGRQRSISNVEGQDLEFTWQSELPAFVARTEPLRLEDAD